MSAVCGGGMCLPLHDAWPATHLPSQMNYTAQIIAIVTILNSDFRSVTNSGAERKPNNCKMFQLGLLLNKA
jgi:hypothetical protein